MTHDPDGCLRTKLDFRVILVEDEQALLHIVQKVKVVDFKHLKLLLGSQAIHHCHRNCSEDEQSDKDE